METTKDIAGFVAHSESVALAHAAFYGLSPSARRLFQRAYSRALTLDPLTHAKPILELALAGFLLIEPGSISGTAQAALFAQRFPHLLRPGA